jgi:hypothetical protein
MIGYLGFHRWRNTEALVDASKLVVHHVDGDGGPEYGTRYCKLQTEILPGQPFGAAAGLLPGERMSSVKDAARSAASGKNA